MTDITSKYLITEVHFEVVTDGTRTSLVQFTHDILRRLVYKSIHSEDAQLAV